ncbi:MAG: alkaline phosphatase family protein [Actinomycetales bacterium]
MTLIPADGGPAVAGAYYTKVMVIAEENEPESAIIGSSQAPYISQLAATYGQATNMQAGYPTDCPSLAAYILMTSGSQQGICDDANPAKHQLAGDNIFNQVAAAGLQWREYAESMPGNCHRSNDGLYLVRHAPPPYYPSERERCQSWDVSFGTTSSGALRSALGSGLPAYSFVTPNACNDMHGATGCTSGKVKRGDDWLARWMPLIMGSPDFQQGRLLVIVTWDEGSKSSNHIPTVLVGRSISAKKPGTAYSHCSTLRTTEDILGLPRIGCATTASSFAYGFGF